MVICDGRVCNKSLVSECIYVYCMYGDGDGLHCILPTTGIDQHIARGCTTLDSQDGNV